MTSTVASGIFNAFAFAGAGFLFSKLNHQGYEKEMKRHNLALEKLASEKEKWFEKETQRKNKIQRLRQELSDANQDLNSTNKSLERLHEELQKTNLNFSREPVLDDFYRPSNEVKEYQHFSSGILGLLGGWILGKTLNYVIP